MNARKRIVLALFLMFGIVAASLGMSAQNGRELSGFYDLTDISDDGVNARFTFAVRLFNHGSADVTAAVVTIEDPLVPDRTYASFYQVHITSRSDVRISGNVLLPRVEFKRWFDGGSPRLIIRFADQQGQAVERLVEVMRTPLGEAR